MVKNFRDPWSRPWLMPEEPFYQRARFASPLTDFEVFYGFFKSRIGVVSNNVGGYPQ
jgi:hypothetical protein